MLSVAASPRVEGRLARRMPKTFVTFIVIAKYLDWYLQGVTVARRNTLQVFSTTEEVYLLMVARQSPRHLEDSDGTSYLYGRTAPRPPNPHSSTLFFRPGLQEFHFNGRISLGPYRPMPHVDGQDMQTMQPCKVQASSSYQPSKYSWFCHL